MLNNRGSPSFFGRPCIKYIDNSTRILVYKQTILPLVEYVSFMLLFNRICDAEKLQKLQNRCLRMCFDIRNPRDMSVKLLHENSNIDYLRTRRNIQLAKVMFNLASENKFRKDGNQNTRAMDTYLFDTDIVRLEINSNSPY